MRIAPSPTGSLHVGTARTALFNYLFARRHKGSFVLRIEDTDVERSDPKYEKNIIEGLQWLGITSDENPVIGGPYAPYRQSERMHTYTPHIEKLLEEGKAFYCFHTPDELTVEKEMMIKERRSPLHRCEFRTMDLREATLRSSALRQHIIRFKTPQGITLSFHDAIRGTISLISDTIEDFSIAKKIDVPLYNFAVVVDDHSMAITHVIRGEDHIANTPKQILLLEALGFSRPVYAHLPLILGSDRSKLSKRHGATSIEEYHRMGYLPEALFNFISFLGWNPGDDREIISREDLVHEFSLERVQKSGAIFDRVKLDWMNGEYIRNKSVDELTKLCLPFLSEFLKCTVPNSQFTEEYIQKIISLEQPRLKKLSEIGEKTSFFFLDPDYDPALLVWKAQDKDSLRESLTTAKTILEDIPKDSCKADFESAFFDKIGGGDKGVILWPLRVALTGKKASPGPFEILEIIGKDHALARIGVALRRL